MYACMYPDVVYELVKCMYILVHVLYQQFSCDMTTHDHLSLNEEDDDDVQVRSKLLPNGTGQPNQYGIIQ